MSKILKKVFYVDTETTGLDYQVHGIWQIAAHIVIDGVEVSRFERNMKPFPGKMVSPKALEKGCVTLEDLRGFEEPTNVYRDLTKELKKYVDKYDRSDKFHLVGYNAAFDDAFLRHWFLDNGDKYYNSWFYYPYIDVMQLAAFYLAPIRANGMYFKLESVMEYFGRTYNAHDAGADISETRWLFEKFERDGLRMIETCETKGEEPENAACSPT